MRYDKVKPAVFLERPNRFIARVMLNDKEETVHVKNTGRCRELLVPGCRVFLSESDQTIRKTKYDLIAVEKERPGRSPLLINMDAQAPNAAAKEFLISGGFFPKPDLVRGEVKYGTSRFDFYLEQKNRRAFVEVKGVTLENNGVASFPDAPTLRGIKHLQELTKVVHEGMEAAVLFVIQMKEVNAFRPNGELQPAFAKALQEAAEQGVVILARDCDVTPDSMTVGDPVPVYL